MKPLRFAMLFFVAVLLLAHDALAYLDPGSGSIVLQAILAGIAGLAVLGRLFWRRFTGLFRRGGRGDDAPR